MTDQPLIDRARRYYSESCMSDEDGGELHVRRIEPITDDGFILAVEDSLGEIDIIFDPSKYRVADSASGYFSGYLDGVRENAGANAQPEYGLTAVAESVWNPFYKQSRCSVAWASGAADNLFLRVDHD